MTAAGAALIEDDGPNHAQMGVVLGGDAFGRRILTAGELAREGYVPHVLVSGPRWLDVCECRYTIEYAVGKGYEPGLFTPLPSDSDSTRSEASFIGEYLKNHGISTILLVTSNYHTRRAAHLMRKLNPGLRVYVVPAPDPFFTPATWWKTRTGQKTFLIEWVKTVATWLGI